MTKPVFLMVAETVATIEYSPAAPPGTVVVDPAVLSVYVDVRPEYVKFVYAGVVNVSRIGDDSDRKLTKSKAKFESWGDGSFVEVSVINE